MCPHTPLCPEAKAPDREAVFEDTGEILPGGGTIAPHRPTDVRMPAPLARADYSPDIDAAGSSALPAA